MFIKPSLTFICAGVLLAASAFPVFADIITLNSGEQYQGKVLSETATDMVVDVQIASGITDQRTFAKKDVKSITKPAEDESFYSGIKAYKIGVNSYTPGEYEALVRALTGFVTKFPQSAHLKEVQANLDAIKEEKARVDGGQLKMGNHWYTAKEAVQEKYQIDAMKTFQLMQAQAMQGDTVAALNTFDQFEKNSVGAAIYPDVVEFATALIKRLDLEIDRAVALAKQQEAQFDSTIILVSEPQKTQTIKARRAKIQAAEAAVEAADRVNIKWKPLLAIADKSPMSLKSTIISELQRLSQLSTPPMRLAVVKAEATVQAMQAGDIATAEANLREAQAAWYAYEKLPRLADAIRALKNKPTPTPTPKATPTPAPGGRRAKTAPVSQE